MKIEKMREGFWNPSDDIMCLFQTKKINLRMLCHTFLNLSGISYFDDSNTSRN